MSIATRQDGAHHESAHAAALAVRQRAPVHRASSESSGGKKGRPHDELNNFFLAEDRRQVVAPFWTRSVGDAPSPS